MNPIEIYTLLICVLFYFSEGKPCPEKTRPHKTRCDAYYKCKEIQPNRHVWVPEKCDKGLVYEHKLKICVLPGDEWECNLGDSDTSIDDTSNKILQKDNKIKTKHNKNNEMEIYFVSQDADSDNEIHSKNENDDNMEVVLKEDISSYDEDSDSDEIQYDSSGDGSESVELDGFIQAENRETPNTYALKDKLKLMGSHENVMKPATMKATTRIEEATTAGTISGATPTSNIDPNLTAHLQRLSQLIDGLKEVYQMKDGERMELRPDQLNAFLAHFNIKNQFDLLNTKPDMNNYKASPISSTTPLPLLMNTHSERPMMPMIPMNSIKNQTSSYDSVNNKLQPETKVMLTKGYPLKYDPTGYSSQQIVVNRPEGSVLFSLTPQYGTDTHLTSAEYAANSPKISEDTLKTVLELSKQMIAAQNVPNVITNPAYYPQPIYPLFMPTATYPQRPFGGSYYNVHDYDTDDKIDGLTPNYHKPYYHHKPSKQRPNGGNNGKPSTTIIHNNVIPVHLSSTNSGEKEVLDNYGHSLGVYPPLPGSDMSNINHLHHHSHRYQNNKFITSVTTVRPIISSTPSNPYAGQYLPPYSTEISLTTPGSLNVAELYTPSPHLNDNNVNSIFQYGNMPRPMTPAPPSYQQMERPTPSPVSSSYYSHTHNHNHNHNALFPTQIDPNQISIRPNSQKIESMEDEADEMASLYQSQAQSQSMAYSYTNDKLSGVNNQLTPSMSYEDSSTNLHKPQYMPRPSTNIYDTNSEMGMNMIKPKYPNENGQLVNIGGNFISYDVFQNSILPLMSANSGQTVNPNIEVITCVPGARQPNITDCTRYYVCSKKDGKVLSYSCPPYTAFNQQTRICDAHTYSYCSKDDIMSTYTVNENKRIQMEAMKVLEEAKRRREQAIKTQQQSITNLFNQYTPEAVNNEKDILNSYISQAASMAMLSSTAKPLSTMKKRKYYCKEGDKIADQTSITSYFVCYKNAQGQMKGHKMTCSKGLIFCPKSKMCTLSAKCS